VITYILCIGLNLCSIDNDGADDKLSDRSGDSADEVEHPKFTVRLPLFIIFS